MRKIFQLGTSSIGSFGILAAVLAPVACSASSSPPPSGSGDSNGTGTGGQAAATGGSFFGGMAGTSSSPTGGGMSGTGTIGGSGPSSGGGGAGNPTAGTPGSGTTGGASASGPTATGGVTNVTCSNADKNIIPMDKTGWVARECNNSKIQGAWYCYGDGVTEAGCPKDMPPFVESKGMCLKGTTLGMEKGWGVGIGLSLNDTGKTATMASVKGPYMANTNGVKGFKIALTGTTGGLPLRINFPKLASPAGVSPFVEVPGAPTAAPYNVLIADALVPEAWMVPNAGETADPASVFDLQIQLPGDSKATAFDFCVESVTPITEGTSTAGGATGATLMSYGAAQCDNFALITIPNYVVQNNVYGGNQHCIQAKTDNASKAGFALSNIQANKPRGGAPGSYPSIVYGWHIDGIFRGGYKTAKTLDSITAIPTSMSITVPGAGSYNASYDNWIGTAATSASATGTLEQMIWLNYRDTTPIGEKVSTVGLVGATWDVWYGTHDGFRTVSYVRTNTTSMNFDLNEFMKDTIARGYAKASDFLLGIQAGFEIWEGNNAGFSVDSFDVAVK